MTFIKSWLRDLCKCNVKYIHIKYSKAIECLYTFFCKLKFNLIKNQGQRFDSNIRGDIFEAWVWGYSTRIFFFKYQRIFCVLVNIYASISWGKWAVARTTLAQTCAFPCSGSPQRLTRFQHYQLGTASCFGSATSILRAV